MKSKIKNFFIFFCLSSSYILVGCTDADIQEYLQQQNIQSLRYDLPQTLKNLRVNLSGETKTGEKWIAREVQEADKEDLAKLFADQEVMAKFAARAPRDPDATKERVDGWIQRFVQGQANGGLVIRDADTDEFIGSIVAGGGDVPGASEVATAIATAYQNKGYGASVLQALVHQLNKEIYQLTHPQKQSHIALRVKAALAKGYSGKDKDGNLLASFPLEALHATTSSDNPRSTAIFTKTGFNPAGNNFGPALETITLSADHADSDALTQALQDFFASSSARTKAGHAVQSGQRYQLITKLAGQEVEYTVSHNKKLDIFKYHWEYHFAQ